MELIDKDALVAEIERRKEYYENIQIIKPVYESNIEDFNELLSFIDTLEVKEMDQKKELDYDDYKNFFKEHPDYNNGDWGFDECWVFAKYFFELGIAVSNKA